MRKIFTIAIMFFMLFVNGCSCHKFDEYTYITASNNYLNSVGLDFTLTISNRVAGAPSYESEVALVKYELSTTREVINFYSKKTGYTTVDTGHGAMGAPVSVYEKNHYYVGSENKIYEVTHSVEVDNTTTYEQSYEQYYNKETELYNINNIVPVLDIEHITAFNIEAMEEKDGYSKATFTAPAPAFATSESELIQYTVVMDRDFYFSSIDFTVVNGETSTTYSYVFNGYNSNVVLEFPTNLGN